MKDFRPISVLSSMYKIIAKTFIVRLKVVMKGLIAQPQGAFIEGRQILDNVFIANDCTRDRWRYGQSSVLCKLDVGRPMIMLTRIFWIISLLV